jgi:hypothetical protein
VWCTQSHTQRKTKESKSELATFTSLVSVITGQCVIILSDNCCVALPTAIGSVQYFEAMNEPTVNEKKVSCQIKCCVQNCCTSVELLSYS